MPIRPILPAAALALALVALPPAPEAAAMPAAVAAPEALAALPVVEAGGYYHRDRFRYRRDFRHHYRKKRFYHPQARYKKDRFYDRPGYFRGHRVDGYYKGRPYYYDRFGAPRFFFGFTFR